MTQPSTRLKTRLPRTPNIARVTTSLGVPEVGPLIDSNPTRTQNRLPATTTASDCQTFSPSRTSVPPSTM